MQKMSNLDYRFAAAELQHLVGAYLNRAFEPRQGVFRLKFHSKGEVNVLAELGVRLHATKYVETAAGGDSGFDQIVRQELENAKLAGVRQIASDRIVAFDLEKNGKYSLIFEMFAHGNAVACGPDGRILKAFRYEQFSSRKIRAGELYSPPPNAKKDANAICAKDLLSLKGPAVSALSKAVNLPPFYLEEACARAGIAFDSKFDGLPEKSADALVAALHSIASAALDPVVYYAGGKPVAFSPFPLEKFASSGYDARKFATFSEALDDYYAHAEKLPDKDRALEKLSAVLAQQTAAVESLAGQAGEFKASGDLIYRNSASFQEILDSANALLGKKLPPKAIEAELAKKFKVKATLEGGKLSVMAAG
ncbi:MAG: NFACT family protein [Candidatus Micrarchaeota archaeon]